MDEIFELLNEEKPKEPEPKPLVEDEKKPVKKKRELSDSRRAQLRLQLEKGRATALKNRQKKALLNKIDKEEDNKKKDEKIAKHILNKKIDNSDDIQSLKNEIKMLKENNSSKEEILLLKKELLNISNGIKNVIEHKRKQEVSPAKIEEKPKKIYSSKVKEKKFL